MLNFSCRAVLAVTLGLVLLINVSAAQEAKFKDLKNQSIKNVQDSVNKLASEGWVPVDAMVHQAGNRTTYEVRLTMPPVETGWFSNFKLTEEEFEDLFAEKREQGFLVAWHQEYSIKKQILHACIWHFDGVSDPPSESQLSDADVKPSPSLVGTVWGPDTRIPIESNGNDAFAKFEQKSIAYMRANQMPSLSAAVAINGKVMYEGTFGYGNLETRLAVKPNAPIRTSALSKLITAVAVLQLVDRGKLDLAQPVYPLLDVEPWKENGVDPRSKDITVLHLLQETGGHDNSAVIEPGFKPRYLATVLKKKDTLVTPTEAIAYMLSQSLAFDPGEKRSSSSYGYFLLARVIEKVTGESYEEYVMKNIARKLKLKSLTMSRTDPDQRNRYEVQNVFRPGTWFPQLAGKDAGKWAQLNTGGYHFGLLDGSHGWMASAGDMVRLGLAIQADRSPILSRNAKLTMVSKPEYVLEIERLEGKPKILWKGCSMYCQQTGNEKKSGITLSLDTRDISGAAGLVCHSARDVTFCYLFNCADTADGQSPKSGYDPIIRSQAYELHDSMKRR